MPLLEQRGIGALSSSTTNLNAAGSITASPPAGVQTGDLLVAVFAVYSVNTVSTTNTQTFTAPSGWDQRTFGGDNNPGGGGRSDLWLWTFTRTADETSADDAQLSWTAPASSGGSDSTYAAGIIFAFNDTETFPYVGSATRDGEAIAVSTTTAYSATSATTGAALSFLVARQNDLPTFASANSHTLLHTEEDVESIFQLAASEVSTGGASTDAPTWTLSNTNIFWVSAMVTFGYNPQNLYPQVIFS